MIAKTAVSAANFAIDKPYSYRIPDGMDLKPGHRVTVPFGRGNRRCEGVILSVEAGEEAGLKAVEQCLDEEPVVTERMLRLAAFIRERYFCTFYDAIRAMLPAGLWFRGSSQVFLTEDRSWEDKELKNTHAARILELLRDLGGSAGEEMLRGTLVDEEIFQGAMQYLTRKKWIRSQTDFSRRLGDKTERVATLASSPEEALEYASHRPKSAAMQKAVLELLCSVGSISVKELCYFTGASTATVNRLEQLGYVQLTERPVLRCREIQPAKLDGPLVLSDAQMDVLQGLNLQRKEENPGVALLYGVTGSGKTSVYVKLIQECIDEGKTAVLLVPEIALTPQLLATMAAYFGTRVAVLHSSLSAGERYDQWKRIRAGEAGVVVGTRSAVFAPCENLGLIILDEEQEHSYKSENSPRYHAREVAIWRGAKEKALVLLGSATPSVESMYRAKSGAYRLYRLPERFGGRKLPEVTVVDMHGELKRGNDFAFSETLQEAIVDARTADKQTIILLNRRGASRALVCVDCRETPECPRCAQRLTYHSANKRLLCHYCGYSVPFSSVCPECGENAVRYSGFGTQKIEDELAALLPDAKIVRMDTDSTSGKNSHEKLLDSFSKGEYDIMIGTQMVAKGLNFPNVTLVGVVSVDQQLYNDDFRSLEKTFSLLTQVVGRSGRGELEGRAIIQTLTPENEIIRLAAKQDYDEFFNTEIRLRKALVYPPYCDLCVIGFVGENETVVKSAARETLDLLKNFVSDEYKGEKIIVLGPMPARVAKISEKFRYRIIIKCRNTSRFRQMISKILVETGTDSRYSKVTVYADINPDTAI